MPRVQAILEGAVARGLGDPAPQFVEAYATVQVKDYARYAMDGLQPDAHIAWRDAHWADDLETARAAGRAMAGKVGNGRSQDTQHGTR